MFGSRAVALASLLAACSSKADDLATLHDDAIAITSYYQPILDELAQRVLRLKRRFNNDLPGAYNALQLAGIADDTLGLWAFEQIQPPSPVWKPAPTTLLGYRAAVRAQIDDIVRQGDQAHLERLVQDVQARYLKGIAVVEQDLFAVESWLDAGTRSL